MMKRAGFVILVAGWMTAVAGTASAVNCAQVNKYLQTGRSVQDVAETMVISEDDVKKCQAEAQSAQPSGTPAGGASGTAGEKK